MQGKDLNPSTDTRVFPPSVPSSPCPPCLSPLSPFFLVFKNSRRAHRGRAQGDGCAERPGDRLAHWIRTRDQR